ncbi:MAG: hypothetical protein AMXMBFR47_45380 [Planctomycetota bacterium]
MNMFAMMIPAVAVLVCCQGCSVSQQTAAPCCPPGASGREAAPEAKAHAAMEVELLALDLSTCDRCTGTDGAIEAAVAELRPALASAGVELRFRKTVVASAAQATALRFQSSPTIRINGRDLPIELRESRCGDCTTLCGGAEGTDCRVWVWRGREYTEAPKGLIVDAILRAYPSAGEAVEPVRGEFTLPDNLRRFFDAKTAGTQAARGQPAGPAVASADGACCDTTTCCAASEKAACCGTDDSSRKGACGCKPQ